MPACGQDAVMTFGQELTAARAAADLSTMQAAAAIGVKEITWQRWERDSNRPGLAHIVKISDLFGVDVEGLLRTAAA